jgi:hypothetical protein
MAKLDRVIDIGGVSYEVEAKTAEKVDGTLTIKKTTLEGETAKNPLVAFNGDDNQEVEIIPTTGGKFKGHIRVPSASSELNGAKNTETRGGITDFRTDAVLNYGDIKNNILTQLLNTSVLYSWQEGKLDPVVAKSINGITLITGSQTDLLMTPDGFAFENYYNAQNNRTPVVSSYLYICTDTKNLYFGTSESQDAIKLTSSTDFAAEAAKLETPRSILVDLGTDARDQATNFNGTSDITTGTTGVLPVSAGGTGNTNLDKVRVGYANCIINDEGTEVIEVHPHHIVELNEKVDAIVNGSIVTGNTSNAVYAATAGHAATAGQATNAGQASEAGHAASADQATSATNDGDGGEITKCYYKINASTGIGSITNANTITIANSGPAKSAGQVGDIWIVYS